MSGGGEQLELTSPTGITFESKSSLKSSSSLFQLAHIAKSVTHIPRVSMTPRQRGHDPLILGNDQPFFKGHGEVDGPFRGLGNGRRGQQARSDSGRRSGLHSVRPPEQRRLSKAAMCQPMGAALPAEDDEDGYDLQRLGA